MKKVITYGTFDLFHEGHYKLLQRAKALGDFLIVGVTSDYFDKSRGKFNVQDDLMTRINHVKETGFADLIIVEEYAGQKIDDIRKYDVDIFTVGSDWTGHFDYLKEYCDVIYLARTQGISSTDIRNRSAVRLGVLGNEKILDRFMDEMRFVSGAEVVGAFTEPDDVEEIYKSSCFSELPFYETAESLFENCDAVYINLPLARRPYFIEKALSAGKHVLTEYPFCADYEMAKALFDLAEQKGLVLMEGLKTAYCPAFEKLISLVKSGHIGKVLSVDANFTQILKEEAKNQVRIAGGSVLSLGVYPILAVFKLLGTHYDKVDFLPYYEDGVDVFTKINFYYPEVAASAIVAINGKSEGSLVISGTEGYVYVPAPWWKTEFFDVRYEDINRNRKYFYKFEGEGLRYETVDFLKRIREGRPDSLQWSREEILAESKFLETFLKRQKQ